MFEPLNPLTHPNMPTDIPEGWVLRSWYSPSEGAYYISYRTVPARLKDTVIPLYGPK